MKKQGTEKR